ERGVPAHLDEASARGPVEARVIVLADARGRLGAAALAKPGTQNVEERRAVAAPAPLGRHEHADAADARNGVPAENPDARTRVDAVVDGDPPTHALGLPPPVEKVRGRRRIIAANGIPDREESLQPVLPDLRDLAHRRSLARPRAEE